jgi:hypothetical protein
MITDPFFWLVAALLGAGAVAVLLVPAWLQKL